MKSKQKGLKVGIVTLGILGVAAVSLCVNENNTMTKSIEENEAIEYKLAEHTHVLNSYVNKDTASIIADDLKDVETEISETIEFLNDNKIAKEKNFILARKTSNYTKSIQDLKMVRDEAKETVDFAKELIEANDFFRKYTSDEIFSEDQVDYELTSLKPNISDEMITEAESRVKSFNGKIKERATQIVNKLKDEVKSEREANSKLKELFNDKGEVSSLDEELYNAAKSAVETVNDKELRAELTKKVDKVNKAIIKHKEEEEAKRKEKERQAAEAAEEERIANEQAAAARQQSSYSSSNGSTSSSNSTKSQSSGSGASSSQQSQAADTSGFNYLGYHYELSSFSGSGQVPADNYVYQWTSLPNHYLIERFGSAGGTIQGVGVGTEVTINGNTYTVFSKQSGVSNDENAYNLLVSKGAAITFQTCDGPGPNSTLTLWWAN